MRRLATDDAPQDEPADVTRYRLIARAVIAQALRDWCGCRIIDAGLLQQDAERFLFDFDSPALVEYRQFLFDVADVNVHRLQQFALSADREQVLHLARELVQTVSSTSGG